MRAFLAIYDILSNGCNIVVLRYKHHMNGIEVKHYEKIIIILFAVMISLYVAKLCGQDNNDEMKFVDDIAPIAVALHQQNGEILPSITIAQAILESILDGVNWLSMPIICLG